MISIPQGICLNILVSLTTLPSKRSELLHKRRQYSWQQAEGIITDEELLSAHKQLKSEDDILNGQLKRLEEFSSEPSPPDKATFEKMVAYWRGDIVGELDGASDELRAKFTEFFDLHVTIFIRRNVRKAIASI